LVLVFCQNEPNSGASLTSINHSAPRGFQWRTPEDVKASYPKSSILKGSRVVFNVKGNDYRLIASVQYQAGVLAIRFFGTHAEYDKIDAERV
jgi:mRNA interferase HigB